MDSIMKEYWTDDFEKFKKKITWLGDLNKLAKKDPDVYAHQVLSHGFMEYAGIRMISYTKRNFLKWVKDHKLKLAEEGWKAFLDD